MLQLGERTGWQRTKPIRCGLAQIGGHLLLNRGGIYLKVRSRCAAIQPSIGSVNDLFTVLLDELGRDGCFGGLVECFTVYRYVGAGVCIGCQLRRNFCRYDLVNTPVS